MQSSCIKYLLNYINIAFLINKRTIFPHFLQVGTVFIYLKLCDKKHGELVCFRNVKKIFILKKLLKTKYIY